jgi:23S rRNA (uracil1939-C5)-methyltransferase
MAQFYKPKKKPGRTGKLVQSVAIKRLSDDGRGIAKIEGKTVFVAGALVGEHVDIRYTSESSRYSEAIVVNINKSSAYRINPECVYYNQCGGCYLQHLTVEEQVAFKQSLLVDKLKHWANIEPIAILPAITDESYHYRQRVRLSVQKKADKLSFGFRQKNSKNIVDIEHCSVMSPSLIAMLEVTRSWLLTYSPKVSHVELVGSDGSRGVIIRHTQAIHIEHRQALVDHLASIKSQCWFQSQRDAPLELVDGSAVDPRLQYCLPDYDLVLSYHPQDFIQSNSLVNQKMIAQALRLLNPKSDEVFLDLFCGIGNFSLPLSRIVKSVTGIEGVKAMVERATQNAQNNQCNNARFLQADLFDIESLSAEYRGVDGLLLDPPRAGAKVICENISKLMPKRIVYVSCDIATFARDAQLLCKNEYTLTSVGMMNMFPQTTHSEVMGLFIRSNSH